MLCHPVIQAKTRCGLAWRFEERRSQKGGLQIKHKLRLALKREAQNNQIGLSDSPQIRLQRAGNSFAAYLVYLNYFSTTDHWWLSRDAGDQLTRNGLDRHHQYVAAHRGDDTTEPFGSDPAQVVSLDVKILTQQPLQHLPQSFTEHEFQAS